MVLNKLGLPPDPLAINTFCKCTKKARKNGCNFPDHTMPSNILQCAAAVAGCQDGTVCNEDVYQMAQDFCTGDTDPSDVPQCSENYQYDAKSMKKKAKSFLDSTAGKVTIAVIALVVLALIALLVYHFTSKNTSKFRFTNFY